MNARKGEGKGGKWFWYLEDFLKFKYLAEEGEEVDIKEKVKMIEKKYEKTDEDKNIEEEAEEDRTKGKIYKIKRKHGVKN